MGIAVVVASLIAGGLIIAQGCAVWAFLRFVKSFGDYTESQRALTTALLRVNEGSLLVHQSNVELLAKLERMQADLQRERVA